MATQQAAVTTIPVLKTSRSSGGNSPPMARRNDPPLIAAIKSKSKTELKRSVDSDSPDAVDGENRTALHWAVFMDDSDLVKALVKRKANVNITDTKGYTPLLLASEMNNFKLVEILLKGGASASAVTVDDQNTALHLVLLNPKPDKTCLKLVKLFLEAPNCSGINVNHMNKDGVTPLTLAAASNFLEAVQLLIKYKADANVADRIGETPLFHAVRSNNVPMVKLLLEHNADLNVRNGKGESLMDLAKSRSELFDQMRRFMSNVPGGDRRLRQVTDEPVIMASKVEELPPELKKMVTQSELRVDLVDTNWEVFCNIMHFVAKKRIYANEEAKAKAMAPPPPVAAPAAAPSLLPISKLTEELISPGNPKDMYKKLTPMGKGGFGMVFSGTGPDKTKIAIKRMPHSAERDKRQNLREVKFLHDFPHPNIVKLRHAYEVLEDHEIWVVMELLEGGTLDEAVGEEFEFNEKHIAFVCKEILQGLSYLHSRCIAHRDLKAANIMMSIEGEIKLIDFGLAVDLATGPKTEMVGSPFWMPPEMILRKPHSYPCDIWSMAICILELANKEPPNSDSALRSMFNVACDKIPSLEKPDRWSPAFKDFLARCLVRDPERRASSDELLKDGFIGKSAKQSDMKQVLRQIFMGNQLKENGFF